ncbi:hypothetical protein IF1G_10110 [Cordyceps javanica]|uniref:Secreted protein n=1 Tax=Cordyceps javanica TaxID=43265 RepID=A0A545UP53_9HYPO|nr:hypothetical protein IF1G_10110 [Cordyceps javanica]
MPASGGKSRGITLFILLETGAWCLNASFPAVQLTEESGGKALTSFLFKRRHCPRGILSAFITRPSFYSRASPTTLIFLREWNLFQAFPHIVLA